MSFSFTKYQIEEVTKIIDLNKLTEIGNGEIISSATVEISKDGLLDDTGILVSDSHTNDTVIFRVKGGSVNTRYLITIVVTLDSGHVRQKFVNMTVE